MLTVSRATIRLQSIHYTKLFPTLLFPTCIFGKVTKPYVSLCCLAVLLKYIATCGSSLNLNFNHTSTKPTFQFKSYFLNRVIGCDVLYCHVTITALHPDGICQECRFVKHTVNTAHLVDVVYNTLTHAYNVTQLLYKRLSSRRIGHNKALPSIPMQAHVIQSYINCQISIKLLKLVPETL